MMDILWILWIIPAVIAVEGKPCVSTRARKAASSLAGSELLTKRMNERLISLYRFIFKSPATTFHL